MPTRRKFLLLCLAGAVMLAGLEVTQRIVALAVRDANETLAARISEVSGQMALVRRLLERDATDIDTARRRRAVLEAAEFVERHMPAARSFPDRQSLLRASLRAVDPGLRGLYCEFGVAGGNSINFIASLVSQPIHGFDSFEGLPEDWAQGLSDGEISRNMTKGTFRLDKLPAVRPNVVLHKGWFNESVPKFRAEYAGVLAFAHMDADLYSSTQTVLDGMADRIVPGTIIQFDEFFNYPEWRKHEYRAFMEFSERYGVRYEFIGYCGRGEQVAVKILGKR